MGSTGKAVSSGARRVAGNSQSAVKPSQVEVNSDTYRAVNGSPRGIGNWAFYPDRTMRNTEEAIFTYGTYSEASRAAREQAAKKGWRKLYVGT